MSHERGEHERRVFAGVLDLQLDVVGVVLQAYTQPPWAKLLRDRVVFVPVKLCFAAAVAPSLERVGSGSRRGTALDRPGRRRRTPRRWVVVELKCVPRPQFALRAGRYDRARLLDVDTREPRRSRGRLLVGDLDLGLLLALGRRDQLAVSPLLLGCQRRAGGAGVEQIALVGEGPPGLLRSCTNGATTLGMPSKTKRSGADGDVDDGADQERAASRNHDPAQPSSHARFCRSLRNRGMSAPSRTKR